VPRISSAITALLSDDDQREHLGSQAKEAVAEKFSLRKMVDEIERLYFD
jgi:glycosyltransferase involved in cell wall biosynthesis